jgi:hypothetical protein
MYVVGKNKSQSFAMISGEWRTNRGLWITLQRHDSIIFINFVHR